MPREYDIILYGASSCAAKYVIKELEQATLMVALAARSMKGIPTSNLPVIECSLEDIRALTARTRLLINCVGPYAHTGKHVIAACVATSTHYIDISGETQFLRETLLNFDADARNAGIKIIQSCGFDSVPSDLGTMHLSKLMENAVIDGTIRAWNLRINTGTWNSLLNSLRSVKNAGNNSSTENERQKGGQYRYNARNESYDVLFRGSDHYIVRRSSEFFKKEGLFNTRYSVYINVGSFLHLILYFIFGFVISQLAKTDWGHSLMVNHPCMFSMGLVRRDRPTDEDVGRAHFELEMRAAGTKNSKPVKKTLKILGPDPAYISTAIFVTQCGYMLLESEENIINGVLTPAMAFHKTKIVEKLVSRGVEFRVIND